ncbi:MAG: hypothetical protein IIA14_13910 [SAR324 cluster bacterium]|nr:hypothetical protein [SAR324 cluster bacterium]
MVSEKLHILAQNLERPAVVPKEKPTTGKRGFRRFGAPDFRLHRSRERSVAT